MKLKKPRRLERVIKLGDNRTYINVKCSCKQCYVTVTLTK